MLRDAIRQILIDRLVDMGDLKPVGEDLYEDMGGHLNRYENLDGHIEAYLKSLTFKEREELFRSLEGV